MRFKPLLSARFLPVAGLIFLGLVTFATRSRYATVRVQDRVGQIDNNSFTSVHGNIRSEAQPQYDRGTVESTLPLSNVIMAFKPSSDQEAALDRLLEEQLDPSSPNFHRWLTPEQFADRFGLSRTDMARIVSWLEDQGFTINLTARGRTWVSFSGTAAQVSSAFHTEIHRYVVNGETHYANATDPQVPSALADVVLGFRSLDDFHPRPRAARGLRRIADRPEFTSSITGSHFLAPSDFATIYGLQSLYNAGITGSGEKIAVMGQTDFALSDIQAFRKNSGLGSNNPVVLGCSASPALCPDPGTSSGDLIEADLDLEWSGGLAPNAPILYVNSTDAFTSLTYAIDQDLSPVLTVSYGNCEAQVGAAFTNVLSNSAKQANAQGMTLVAPSGDDGAADCDTGTSTAPPTIAKKGLAVDVPAAIPYFTGVGGTQFDDASGTYWSSTNNAENGSALSYIPESVWNETVQDGSLSAGGGGVSAFFAKPSWQTGTGVPADGKRDVPDISLNASAAHDPYLICTSGSCVNGFRMANNDLQVVGGTSAGAPSFAAIMALIDQQEKGPQGNVNPVLYSLAAKNPGAFHDITSGNNIVPCAAGSPNCPASGQMGYSAGPGYDLASGLGSIDAASLAAAWPSSSSPPPSPDFQLSINPTSLSMNPGGSATATITIQAQNGFNGAVTFTTSVPSTLGGVTASAAQSVTGSGSTTLTVTASQTAHLLPRGGFHDPTLPVRLALVLIFGLGAATLGFYSRNSRIGVTSPPRVRTRLALGLALICLLGAAVSCGGGSSSSASGNTNTTPPPETGSVTVTAGSGSLSHSATVSVTVN
jgi:subtilase family serine protease